MSQQLVEQPAALRLRDLCTSPSSASAPSEGLMPRHKLGILLSSRNASHRAASCSLPGVGFVGIGKTGSLFMQSALEFFAHEQLLSTIKPGSRSCSVGARMGWHHASAFLQRRAFGAAAWEEAFTFALVRDPWARLVSHWAFHIGSRNPLDAGHLTPEQRSAARLNESHSIAHFRSWMRHARHVHPPNSTEAWKFTTSDAHGNEQARTFNASQLSWLVDERGRLLVDDVYRLEDLESRWPQLQQRVCGLQAVSYRATLNHPTIRAMDHPSQHAHYREYYDEETSNIVAEYMEADIRRFGYRPP